MNEEIKFNPPSASIFFEADPEVLTFYEACSVLRISYLEFVEILKTEKIPCRKIGAKVFFTRGTLIAWVERGDHVFNPQEDLA